MSIVAHRPLVFNQEKCTLFVLQMGAVLAFQNTPIMHISEYWEITYTLDWKSLYFMVGVPLFHGLLISDLGQFT